MNISKFPFESILNVRHYGAVRNIFLGANLCHAMEKENYIHIPFIIVIPSIYTGYNVYKNKDIIAKYINENIINKPSRSSWPF